VNLLRVTLLLGTLMKLMYRQKDYKRKLATILALKKIQRQTKIIHHSEIPLVPTDREGDSEVLWLGGEEDADLPGLVSEEESFLLIKSGTNIQKLSRFQLKNRNLPRRLIAFSLQT
jgi:hypothetical protein